MYNKVLEEQNGYRYFSKLNAEDIVALITEMIRE